MSNHQTSQSAIVYNWNRLILTLLPEVSSVSNTKSESEILNENRPNCDSEKRASLFHMTTRKQTAHDQGVCFINERQPNS